MLWLFLLVSLFFSPQNINHQPMNLYEIPLLNIHGEETTLAKYKGQPMLIVNVASECGLTPQYQDLQSLYDRYQSEGLVILGFPSNDFMGQEPGTEEEILEFCRTNFGVSFPLFSKISVKGEDIHPLYEYLTTEKLNGKADSEVTWNFQKYLIGKNGEIIEIFSPRQRVLEEEVLSTIQKAL